MGESYETWIANLMNGTISAGEQAVRARFRAAQAAKRQPRKPTVVSVAVETTGPNTWAVSTTGDVRHDGLATYTLMGGPGIPGVVASRQEG
jgi:hypothetical protein